ncbi:MAG TPA: PEP-CTERM sorting domain-containing protein [Steroidobacteraceae bacterium]|jgi:hypothetical protein
MIRFLPRTLFGLIALAALSGTAQAAFVPATWTDDYITDQEINPDQPAVYQHDLSFDGFVVGQDLVSDFLLTIDLADDLNDSGERGTEKAHIDIPGILGDRNVFSFEFGDGAYAGASIAGLFELNLLGTLSVTISSLKGDFVLTGSHLVAKGWQEVSSVPEPGTLGLLGLGLLGLAVGTRRRSPLRSSY